MRKIEPKCVTQFNLTLIGNLVTLLFTIDKETNTSSVYHGNLIAVIGDNDFKFMMEVGKLPPLNPDLMHFALNFVCCW